MTACCLAAVVLSVPVYGRAQSVSGAGRCANPVDHPVCVASGEPAPRFELRDLKSRWHRMSEYLRKPSRKPMLIDFFAMNCPVCKKMMPSIVDFAARHGDSVQVFVIATSDPDDRGDRKLREYFKRKGANFPILMDSNGVEAARWVAMSGGRAELPQMFLVDENGIVRGVAGGAHESIWAALPGLRSIVGQ